MKAVILAGGLGTRMREETEFKPKPMVEIGGRPVLWHLMKILSHQGISDFVVLGGYKVEAIKQYFLNLSANIYDFTISKGQVVFHSEAEGDEKTWTITVLDTGLETQTAGRLLAARDAIGLEPFLCTYGDGLADVNLNELFQRHESQKKVATMTVFQPENRFGVVELDSRGNVNAFKEKPRMTDLINIGFFVFGYGVWDYLNDDEPLEESPLRLLAERGELSAHKHEGFWMPMDTYREYVKLSELWRHGHAPWATWLT